MSGLSIKALFIISLAMLATGCRVAIIVPTGGNVVSSNGAYNCPEASVCEFEVTEAPFSETFTAQASPGYEFEKWSDGSDFLCGESTAPTCVVGISDNPLGAVVIALFNSSYVMPIFTDVGIDTDLDGIRNELDDDDDNDGLLDDYDDCPIAAPDLDGSGCPFVLDWSGAAFSSELLGVKSINLDGELYDVSFRAGSADDLFFDSSTQFL